MKKLLLIALLFSFNSYLQSAAPDMHIYCAELYFERCKPDFKKEEREAFIRGTLWPDIRHYVGIARNKTHGKNVTLKEVMKTKNPFTAGKLFHTYVDEQREKIAQREKIYDLALLLPKKHKANFIKLVEDQLIYCKINSKQALNAMKVYDKEAEEAGIAHYKVRAWQRILSGYVKQSPLAILKQRAKNKQRYLKLDAEMVPLCAAMLEEFSKNEQVITYVNTFVSEFKKLLKK